MSHALQVTMVRSELEKLKRDHEQLKAELSKVWLFIWILMCLIRRMVLM